MLQSPMIKRQGTKNSSVSQLNQNDTRESNDGSSFNQFARDTRRTEHSEVEMDPETKSINIKLNDTVGTATNSGTMKDTGLGVTGLRETESNMVGGVSLETKMQSGTSTAFIQQSALKGTKKSLTKRLTVAIQAQFLPQKTR